MNIVCIEASASHQGQVMHTINVNNPYIRIVEGVPTWMSSGCRTVIGIAWHGRSATSRQGGTVCRRALHVPSLFCSMLSAVRRGMVGGKCRQVSV